MGTVGLSFGSPTSGSGFDVTATVNTIVTNLQKIEQPWKDQLTKLQSQDTVISSLGSLFSKLSTDVSSLTDLNGVLAQKTGSSSDPNTLQLTSASSAATAGTHTVVVNNLAQTSTGYLDPIANASDTLAGTLSVTVNNNTETFDLSKLTDQTLNGLKSAINASGMGVTANILTDAGGSRLSLVSNTSGLAGEMTVTSSVTDAAAVTGTNPTGALNYNDAVDGKNASLTIDGIGLSSASNTVTNLIPGVTFQLLSASPTTGTGGTPEQIQVVIANDNSGVETAVNQFVTDYNALIQGINTQEGNDSSGNPEPMFGSPTISLIQQQLLSGINAPNPSGSLDAVTNALNPSLSGSISLQVGSNQPQTVTLDPSQTSISDLAAAINAANVGVTAGIATLNGQSTLTLASQTGGPNGALTVNSNLVNTSATMLTRSVTYATAPDQNSTATFSAVPGGSDALSGSVTVQVGNGSAVTVNAPGAPADTLTDVMNAINNTAGIGATASITTNADGSQVLSLVSNTAGSGGNLTVTSSLLDTTNTTTSPLNYTASSDIGTLTSLGISLNNDGSMTFDASALDSVINSDYQSVVGFFQNANGWGTSFAAVLSNSGSSSSTGILTLAGKSNSSIEDALNKKIASEEALIADQQKKLTAELNQANQILQALPSQLDGMNQLYSAITGYNQKG